MAGMGTRASAGRKAGVAGCLVAATALLVAGCSSGGGSGSGGGTGSSTGGSGTPSTFAAALAAIPSTSWDSSYFEFGDVADVTRLNNASSGKSALNAYSMVGESQLIESETATEDALGFDPLTVSSAVTVGNLPHSVGVLYGSFDPSTVGTKLAALGFKKHGDADGGTLWAIGDNDQINPNNPTEDPSLNVLDVAVGRIVYGGSTAEVEAVAASGSDSKPLAENASLSAIASCLGSAKAGEIGPEPATDASASTYVGIGLLASSASDASEELCVTAPSSSRASAIEANWTQQIEHGKSASRDEAWSTLFTDPQATIVGGSPIVVRLTAEQAPGARVGTLLEAYFGPTVDLSSLIDQSTS